MEGVDRPDATVTEGVGVALEHTSTTNQILKDPKLRVCMRRLWVQLAKCCSS